jgi:hypothetical protein
MLPILMPLLLRWADKVEHLTQLISGDFVGERRRILYPVTAPYVACVFFFVRLHRCISASRRVLGLWAMLSMGQEINHESYVWKGGFK